MSDYPARPRKEAFAGQGSQYLGLLFWMRSSLHLGSCNVPGIQPVVWAPLLPEKTVASKLT